MTWGMVATAVIGAGAGLYGQNKARQSAHDLQKQQQPLIDQQERNMKFLSPYGQQLMGQGQQNMTSVQNLLQGQINNRQSAMQANAPLINQMTQAQQGAVQAQRGLYPRGGMGAAQASQLPYQLQGNISNTLFAGRQNAIGQLGQLGSNQASLGMGAMGQGAGLTNSMLNYGLNAQNQMFGQGSAMGQGVASLLGPAMQYWMMSRQGTVPTQGQTPYLPSGSGGFGSPTRGWTNYNVTPGADPYGSLNNMGPYTQPPSLGEGYE